MGIEKLRDHPRATGLCLFAIVVVNVSLTLYGIMWGLPDRWSLDEQVTNSLRLLQSRSLLTITSMVHPQFYNFVLAALFVPYLAVLKVTGYPFEKVQTAASTSWIALTMDFPDFATGLYMVARLSSVVFGALGLILVYRIARQLYGVKAGLVAALTLAVTMGFVETNHLAKHTSLVVFMVLVVGSLAISAYQRGDIRRLYWASFFSGLASTAKLDGVISVVFVLLACYYMRQEGKFGLRDGIPQLIGRRSVLLFASFVTGISVGWPAVLTSLNTYVEHTQGKPLGLFYGGFPPLSLYGLELVLEKLTDNVFHIFVVFGVPLGIAALASFAWLIVRARTDVASRILLGMMLAYSAVVVGYYTAWPGAYTKLMIHLVPALAIAIGGAFQAWRMSERAKIAVLAVVVAYSALYTYRADLVFAERDTRYASTAWIEQQVPKGASIEMVHEVNLLFASRLIPDYEVIYLGRNSKTYKGSLFRVEREEVRAAMDKLTREGSRADYFIMVQGGDFVTLPTEGTFLWRLLNGREAQYHLVQSFSYPDTLLLSPKSPYTSPDILIFKRVGQVAS
ncbi:MAG: glycosyltransferase family 39 protein [Desulfomonile tiedjei]|nr:glycosyltransferase family 39 protein [Desulfomonile tiedjei]